MKGAAVRLKNCILFVTAFGALVLCGLWSYNAVVYRNADAPVPAVLSRWQAILEIRDDKPRLSVVMKGEVLFATNRRPARVPLFPRGSVFRNVTLNGRPVSPLCGETWYFLDLHRAGHFTVAADLEVKPGYDRGEHTLRLVRPPFVESSLAVNSEQAWEVRLADVADRIEGTDGEGTHGRLALGRQRVMNIAWQPPRAEVRREGTASVTPSVAWTVGEKFLRADTRLEVKAMGGPLSIVSLALPPGTDNLRLAGATIRDSRRAGDQLDIFFCKPLTGTAIVELSYSIPRAKGDLAPLPQMVVVNGRIDPGGWALVVNDSRGILLEHSTDGVEPASDLDIPAPVLGLARGKPVFLYEYSAREVDLIVDVVSSEPFPVVNTIADRADILCVVRPGGEEITDISYRVRNNGKQFLKVTLPRDVVLLRVEVEDRSCRVSRDGDQVLVPLAKSVQTLGGLVPFPVRLVYCRQGVRAARSTLRLVDLPELERVPVTVVNATVMCPEETRLRTYRSALRRVTRFTNKKPDPLEESLALLVRNYYHTGYEAYRENRLEDAEEALGNVVKLVPGSDLATDAGNLLWNIRVGRGEVDKDAGRMERAKAAKIQEGLTTCNPSLEREQQVLIETGIANFEEGDEELGVELLEEARQVGKKLGQRGASWRRQHTLWSRFSDALERKKEQRARNRILKQKLAMLQKQAAETLQTGSVDAQQVKGRVFAYTLNESAQRRDMDLAQAQDAVFGNVGKVSYGKKQVQVTKGAKARKLKKAVKQRRAAKVSKKTRGTRRTKGSLEEQNKMLANQVAVLVEAIDAAGNADAAQAQTSAIQPAQPAVARLSRQVKQADWEVDRLVEELEARDDNGVVMNDMAIGERFAELQTWAGNNLRTIGQFDDSANRQFQKLNEKITRAAEKARKKRQQRLAATNVVVNVNNFVAIANPSDEQALTTFFDNNYLPQTRSNEYQFQVENGRMTVLNAGSNAYVVNDAFANMRANDGQVVTFVGHNLSGVGTNACSALTDVFSNRTDDGRYYAVLDEAQYRTFVQSGEKRGSVDGVRGDARREVIVGTPNSVVGEQFKLVESGATYNGLALGGTTVNVPHDKYLVVGNGANISVLKGGAARDWQDKDEVEVALTDAETFSVSIPEIGTELLFEKTLLSAGESPDIEMQL